MIDTSHIDLVGLAGVQLRKQGGQLVGACPICADGNDRFFIDTRRNAWGCRRCTEGSYRNALHLAAMLEGYDAPRGEGFKAAMQRLNMPLDAAPNTDRPAAQPRPDNPIPQPRDYASNDPDWQRYAGAFITLSVTNMRSREGVKVFNYLVGRGVEPCLIQSLEIGYNPASHKQVWGAQEVWLPQGVVIPWEHPRSFEHYTRVRIRTGGNPKYSQAAGAANSLFYVRPVRADSFIVLCEGELDALALRSELIRYERATGNTGVRRVVPIATGGTTQGRIQSNAVVLSVAKRVLVAFDDDDNGAGDNAAKWWLDRLPNARRWMPTAHDINDMVQQDGARVVDWLRDGLRS